VILGTGDLWTLRNVAKASVVAMMARRGLHQTSTGKETVERDTPSDWLMARAIREYAQERHGGGLQTRGWDSYHQAVPGMASVDEEELVMRGWLRIFFVLAPQRHAR